MVRACSAVPGDRPGRPDRSDRTRLGRGQVRLGVVIGLVVVSGCALVPRSRMDECQKLTQALRADNARLKDRVLAVQGQNRDYAERAVDDGRRLAIQDEAIERLEHSVQAYQDERARLEAAYKQLASSLGVSKRGGGTERLEASPPATGATRPNLRASARNASASGGMDEGTPH